MIIDAQVCCNFLINVLNLKRIIMKTQRRLFGLRHVVRMRLFSTLLYRPVIEVLVYGGEPCSPPPGTRLFRIGTANFLQDKCNGW